MYLKAGVAKLQKRVLMMKPDLIEALDMHDPLFAVKCRQHLVELGVSRPGRKVPFNKVGFLNGRKDAAKNDVAAALGHVQLHRGEYLCDLDLEIAKAITRKFERRQIRFEIELTDLGCEAFVAGRGDQLRRVWHRMHSRIHEEHLLLGTDAANARLEFTRSKHLLKYVQIRKDCLSKLADVGVICVGMNCVFSHGLPLCSSHCLAFFRKWTLDVVLPAAYDQALASPTELSKAQKVKHLQRKETSDLCVHLQNLAAPIRRMYSRKKVNQTRNTQSSQDGRNPQPKWTHMPADEESIFSKFLVERHQDNTTFRCTHSSRSVICKMLALLDRLKILIARMHRKAVLFADRVPIANLKYLLFSCGVFHDLRVIIRIGNITSVDDARCLGRKPNQRFMGVYGRFGIMLAALKTHCHRPDIIQVFKQRSFKLFFNAEKDRYRQLGRKAAVPHGVADGREGHALGRGRMEIEGINLAPGRFENRHDCRQKLHLFAVFRKLRRQVRAWVVAGNIGVGPVAVEILVNESDPFSQCSRVPGKEKNSAVKPIFKRRKFLGDSASRTNSRRLIAVNTAKNHERRTFGFRSERSDQMLAVGDNIRCLGYRVHRSVILLCKYQTAKVMSDSDTLTGTVKGPGQSPQEYTFITRDNSRVRIGEFVYYEADAESETRRIIGTVKARKLIRGLPDDFLSEPGVPPAEVAEILGIDPNPEVYEITVETIGYFSESLGDFVNPRIPPNPGDAVRLASAVTLASVLSPRREGETGSAHIGSLLTRDAGEVPIVLSVKDVVSTHLAILASTGSGKSYTAGVLVEEMLRPYNRAAVLIVDPHGEYHTMASIQGDPQFTGEDGYRPEVKIFTPDRIKVRFSSLTEGDIRYLLPDGTSDKMLHFLRQAYRSLQEKLRAEGRKEYLYNYFDLRDEVQRQQYGKDERDAGDGGNVSSIQGLLWRLDSRFDQAESIFHAHEHIELGDLYRPGRVTILDLSDIEQSLQQVIVGTLLRRVNKAREQTVRGHATSGENFLDYPVFTLLEEAHRFAPAGSSVVSTNVLKQILSEGRKFGVGIGLITQRPGKLDQDVLSQCMTQIIMRIVNPIDQQTIAQSVEGTGRAMLAELPALTKGQAIISGVGINTPVMCRIRPRLTAHGGETFDAPAQWAKWYEAGRTKRDQDSAPYLKPDPEKKPEKLGNIRI